MRHINTPTIAVARQTLRNTMTRVGWPASPIFDAQLALCELLVNAWRHTETPAPLVEIISEGDVLRVSVTDESPVLPSSPPLSLLAESGRGLQLVAALTHGWGVDPHERAKSVWFELRKGAV
ncbi:ATP-binding protein [Kitasatospora xanthocidica]|uniref:ATP-binding protein n=1 Tax=Kitasatospora xanthocidica TaxID=83382 RepID=A0A372ZMR1_9ACTN|nr:ATP-binding protein [Kitasatospora xanthocidica]RGD56527.1 ATP-binding protein [Kitasatospora xanthocidica]